MFWMLLSFVLITPYHHQCNALNDEGLALLSFLQNTSQASLISWNSSDVDPCSWHGITCIQNRVVSLNLPGSQLSGLLSPALGNLPALRHLNLKNNYFSGSLPVELFNLQNIQSLILSGNTLSGSLPTQVGNLKHLQNLDLSQNQLSGALPVSMAQCKKLRVLVLGQNRFSGSLPAGLGTNLSSLQRLNLSCNNFHGLIPDDMGNLSSLKGTLDLSHNSFSGSVPASLGSLHEDVYIDLSYNNLSGPIPETGTLVNAGPTAFSNNPGLCGPPLKISCQGSSDDLTPDSGGTKKHGHSRRTTLVLVTTVGISLVGLLVTLWYMRIWFWTKIKRAGAHHIDEKLTISREIFCFSKRDTDTLSENMEQCDFVALDSQVNFDLELLLKASAFLLGKTANGILYKVVLDNGPTLVVRRLEDGSGPRFKEFQSEVEALGKIRHPNLVSLRAYCCSDDEKLLIYDYIPNGDLAAAIHGKVGGSTSRPLSWSVRVRIMKGIAKGLAFLHEHGPKRHVHGNLKPRNILLGENMEPCISDVGLIRLPYVPEEPPAFQGEQMNSGTPQPSSPYELTPGSSPINKSCYQAPEASRSKKPSQKWDVYSFGVILLEMITGKSQSEMDLPQWVQLSIDERKPLSFVIDPFLGPHWHKEESIGTILKVALACIQKNPDRRPTMRNVSDTLEKAGSKDSARPDMKQNQLH